MTWSWTALATICSAAALIGGGITWAIERWMDRGQAVAAADAKAQREEQARQDDRIEEAHRRIDDVEQDMDERFGVLSDETSNLRGRMRSVEASQQTIQQMLRSEKEQLDRIEGSVQALDQELDERRDRLDNRLQEKVDRSEHNKDLNRIFERLDQLWGVMKPAPTSDGRE